LVVYALVLGCASPFKPDSPNLSRGTIYIDGEILIDGTRRQYQNKVVNIAGDVIIRNGGELLLFNSVVNVISNYDEEHTIALTGAGILRAYGSLIEGVVGGAEVLVENVTTKGRIFVDGRQVSP
jgi:hypothetical protein